MTTFIEIPGFINGKPHVFGEEPVRHLPGLATAMMDVELGLLKTESVYRTLDPEEQDGLRLAGSILSQAVEKRGGPLEEAVAVGTAALTVYEPPQESANGK